MKKYSMVLKKPKKKKKPKEKIHVVQVAVSPETVQGLHDNIKRLTERLVEADKKIEAPSSITRPALHKCGMVVVEGDPHIYGLHQEAKFSIYEAALMIEDDATRAKAHPVASQALKDGNQELIFKIRDRVFQILKQQEEKKNNG